MGVSIEHSYITLSFHSVVLGFGDIGCNRKTKTLEKRRAFNVWNYFGETSQTAYLLCGTDSSTPQSTTVGHGENSGYMKSLSSKTFSPLRGKLNPLTLISLLGTRTRTHTLFLLWIGFNPSPSEFLLLQLLTHPWSVYLFSFQTVNSVVELQFVTHLPNFNLNVIMLTGGNVYNTTKTLAKIRLVLPQVLVQVCLQSCVSVVFLGYDFSFVSNHCMRPEWERK